MARETITVEKPKDAENDERLQRIEGKLDEILKILNKK